MPLITVSQFLDLCDARVVAGRVLDGGRDAALSDLSDAATEAGRRVAKALATAEGRLLSAVRVGSRYKRDELETIAADDEKNGLLHWVLASLADGVLLQRRRLPADNFAAMCPAYAEAEEQLQLLREGNRIFDEVPGVPEAGLPAAIDTTSRIGLDRPALIDNVLLFGQLDPSIRPGVYQGRVA